MIEHSPPPVPADADLRHYPNMPLEVARLRDSGIAMADAEAFRCAVLLWCASWHQIPAGSLPDDDAELCRLVGLGRDLRSWRKIKGGAMRSWVVFNDGRFYHRVVCEKVIESLNSTQLYEWNKACARVRKENFKRTKSKLDKLPSPERPAILHLCWPETVTEREPLATVRVPEREFSSERKGKDILSRGVPDRHPLGNSSDSSSVATREGLEGPARDDVQTLIGRAANIVRMPA